MTQNTKHSHAMAYLRQLCCSGLDKETVIPEFLHAVQAVIPSGSNVFTEFDEQFENLSYLLEFSIPDLAEATPQILSGFFTPECKSRFYHLLMRHTVLADATLLDKSFYRSDMYNLLYRPYDQHHGLWGVVAQHGKPVGLLNLFRPRLQKPFNAREQALCKQLLPYLAHAFAGRNENIQYGEPGSPGMMVMDTHGAILYLTDEAKRLLALACQPALSLDVRHQEARVLTKLAQLCQNLQSIFYGKHAAPPSWKHTNGRGRFTFRASWLNRLNKESDRLVSMTVVHQEPLALKILRALQVAPLSPVQKQVSHLLAQGLPNELIGARLNIKLSTVKEHVSNIFDKLGIGHREELLPLLLTMDNSRKIMRA